ncbi:hypothetical protein [Streptosporangium sp. NPDC004631]
MSFFDRIIDAMETATKIVLWGSVITGLALRFTNHVGMPLAISVTITFVSLVILCSIREPQEHWNDRAAEEVVLRREQLRANREIELRREIRRLQQQEQRR